jgi:hypothetical protein
MGQRVSEVTQLGLSSSTGRIVDALSGRSAVYLISVSSALFFTISIFRFLLLGGLFVRMNKRPFFQGLFSRPELMMVVDA